MSLIKKRIAEYLDSKKNSWSPTTLEMETSRLNGLAEVLDGNPKRLWKELERYNSYTRVSMYGRVCTFWDAAFPNKANPYTEWREKNRNFFKNAYEPKRVSLTYEEALKKVKAIEDEAIRARALDIIKGAVRWAESEQPKGREYIVGKGSKKRPDFRPETEGPAFTQSYDTFLRKLKAATGLTPHALRKLALTHAAENGAEAADLMEIAGWKNITTATYYLQPKRVNKLKGFLK
jgi:integrase